MINLFRIFFTTAIAVVVAFGAVPAAEATNLYVTGAQVNVREKASTSSRIVKRLPYRAAMTFVSGPQGGWYRVRAGDVEGYVAASLASTSAPAERTARSSSGGRKSYRVASASVGEVSLNSNTGKYHERGCRYYDCGACEPTTRANAEANGVPCKKCH